MSLGTPILVTSSANAASAANSGILPEGYLTLVQPHIVSGSLGAGSGLYCEVVLQKQDLGGTWRTIKRAWCGYLRGADTPPSLPGTRIESNWRLRAVLYATADFGSLQVQVDFITSADEPMGGGVVHAEPVGSGLPAKRLIDLGDPAAGAEFAVQTVPACTLWRRAGFRAPLTTGVTVGTRCPTIRIDAGGGAGQVHGASIAIGTQSASLSVDYFAQPGAQGNGASGASAIGIPLPPDERLPAGYNVRFVTANLDALDNWGQGYLLVEEWASP